MPEILRFDQLPSTGLFLRQQANALRSSQFRKGKSGASGSGRERGGF